jgi:hypothetical protein
MPAPETLRAQQFGLAAYIRDPEGSAPPPGIEKRRLAIYRDLFFNSLLGLLSGNFPVIRRILGDAPWRELVRDFYREFRCTTPLFPELPREFIQYLLFRAEEDRGDAPWLLELAHYEWAELALDLSEAELDTASFDPDGDLIDGVPMLSPLAWPLAYTWPVHRLSPEFQPTSQPDAATFLLVQRDPKHKVRFNELSALTFRLLQRISEHAGLTGREQLLALAAEAQSPDPEAFVAQGRDMFEQLRAGNVVPGTRRN